MDNQKGSVKDRLRAMLLFLKYKKQKRKKEKEFIKKKKKEEEARIKAEQMRLYGKYYSKPKVFWLTILGLLGNLLMPKFSSKKIEKELLAIQEEENKIMLKLEQDYDIKEIYHDIDTTYQRLEDLKVKHRKKILADSFNPLKSKQILKNIDNKQKSLMIINDICRKKEKEATDSILLSNVKKQEAKEQNNDNLQQDYIYTENSSKTYAFNNNYDELMIKKGESKSGLLVTVKRMNDDLKKYEKEVKDLKEKIEQEKTYSTLYEYEFKLKQLKNCIRNMLEQYEKLKDEFQLEILSENIDIETMDKYELRKSEKSILDKINICEGLLTGIELKKKELSSNVQENQPVKEKSKTRDERKKQKSKKDSQEEEKKQLQAQYDETYLAMKMIMNNISDEKKMVDKIRKKLYNQPPIMRRRSVFLYAKRFTTSILTFGFNLIPFRFFRNRLLGKLVSSIMVNNSLRTTRIILGHDVNYIVYNEIIRDINSSQDSVSKLYDICLDSQEQIRRIKEHLDINFSMIGEFDSELADFYKQLNILDRKIEGQINSLSELNQEYTNIKTKVKVRNFNRN